MSNLSSSQGNADWNDDIAFHNQTGKWAVSTVVNYLVLAKMWINRLPPYWKDLVNCYNLRERGMGRGCGYVQEGQITSVMSISLWPLDCSPPGSSVHGILQAKILDWVAIPSFRGSSWPRDGTQVSCVSYSAGRFVFTTETLGKSWEEGRHIKRCKHVHTLYLETSLLERSWRKFTRVLKNEYTKLFIIVLL